MRLLKERLDRNMELSLSKGAVFWEVRLVARGRATEYYFREEQKAIEFYNYIATLVGKDNMFFDVMCSK